MMDEVFLALGGAAFLVGGAGMAMFELRAIRAGRQFFRNRWKQQLYWMTYLSCFILAACFLLKTVTG